jgi:hypothetical protein
MLLRNILIRSLIKRFHRILILVFIRLKSPRPVLSVVVVALPSGSHRSDEIIALNTIHSWHDAWEYRAVALQLSRRLSFADAPVVQGVPL